jgi:hypothetical protein
MARVALEQSQTDALESRARRGDLVEDLDAVPLVLDHPLDSSHLTLDAAKAVKQGVLVLVLDVSGHQW